MDRGDGAGLPDPSIGAVRLTALDSAIKTVFDRCVAAATLVLVAPVLLTCAVLIQFAGESGPVLGTSPRVGRHGREFAMLHFRTTSGLGIGRMMEAYGIDHLPELINVLRGDMSLVGPRPQLVDSVRTARDDRGAREAPVDLRPGITGLWTLASRREPTVAEVTSLERVYVESWSLDRDIRILTRTAAAVRFRPETA